MGEKRTLEADSCSAELTSGFFSSSLGGEILVVFDDNFKGGEDWGSLSQVVFECFLYVPIL